jgi:hypothetical protein
MTRRALEILAPLLLVVACGGETPSMPDAAVAPLPRPACGGPGTICNWAGTGTAAFNGDGHAPGDTTFYWPMDLEFASDGTGYVLDWNNHRVRRVQPDGTFRTVVGSDFPGDGPPDQSDLKPEGALGTDVELNHPTDLQILPDGQVLIAAWHNHKIRRYDPISGRVWVICGSGPGYSGMHDLATRALLAQPKSIALDSKQNIFVADSRNQRIRLISDMLIDTVAGTGKKGFAGDGGNPNLADFYMQQVDENPEPGGSIAIDATDRIYLADTYNNRIRRIDLVAATVTTVAGDGNRGFGGDGGQATAAQLNQPRDLEFGPDGRLYIADTDNHRIRVVDLTTGVITTVAGNGQPGDSGDGAAAEAASLKRPFGIAFDRQGQLYVADTFNNRIRKVVR